ncbi:ribosomal protein L7/L12 [Nocardioides lianchengensis]|uniref:ribosomal protein L7/L12 n=1 Tax=Nocardioides lianchengensis TaxID=1045774 RepID=UPI000B818872|nr:ribosomal protein L7/L12 [Nocardioides lianchengensis]
MKGLREVTGAGLVDAKNAVESAPVIVVRRLSAASADRVRDRLESAGATAAVLTNDD